MSAKEFVLLAVTLGPACVLVFWVLGKLLGKLLSMDGGDGPPPSYRWEPKLLEWLQDRRLARTSGKDIDVIRMRRRLDKL